jgi:precorrin-8X/cobalt-precorrin-8 methylmutase
MQEFDAYLMVDWSASSRPAQGLDSVWYCLLTRTNDRLAIASLENPATRSQARAEVKVILREMVRRSQSVLVGFDFPYGYPSGFAAALGLEGPSPWLATWREITSVILDGDDNRNNRFTVAAGLNSRVSGGRYPFWGCPRSCECSTMSSTKGGTGPLAEKRITDVGNMQPIWKLFGNGSVGSQALLGIPTVSALRNDSVLAPVSSVWPFETGLRRLSGRRGTDSLILHAEIYPSLLPVQPADEVKDRAQVRKLAYHFATLDDADRLSDLFAGSNLLTAAERDRIEREEGWTLGVEESHRTKPLALKPRPAAASAVISAPLSAKPPHRSGAGRTTEPGYENRNGQTTIRSTGLAGTDHGQCIYVLRCSSCGHEYGANGSDIHTRRCPACQGGRPGLRY